MTDTDLEAFVSLERGALPCSPESFEAAWSYEAKIEATPNPMNPKYAIRRKQATFGATYRFAGQVSRSPPRAEWPELVEQALAHARKRSGSDAFNVVHVNWYPNGKAGLDPHADDERDMVPGQDIYSYTFLSEPVPHKVRGFQIYRFEDLKKPVAEYKLEHGDLLIMRSGMQQRYKHGVKKTAAKNFKDLRRVNMTVRAWKPEKLQ